MPYSGPPQGEVPVPGAVCVEAAGDPVELVWANELGGLTYEVGGRRRRFVKWAPPDSILDLSAEAERMTWARRYTAVPTVLGLKEDPTGTILITSPLPGTSAVAPRWKREPATAVSAIGNGLRALHDVLPVAECPFEWSVEGRLQQARARAVDPAAYKATWHQSHQSLSVDLALEIAADSPAIDHAVVCHGDACAPNTLVENGEWSGHVDLGTLGVADRWADIAVAAWSTEWNYGPGWTGLLLDAYDIAPDPARMTYYRLLWDLA